MLIGDTILRLLLETGPPFYVVIRATRRSSRWQGKGSTFISQLFYALGIEPATSKSEVKRSSDWTNPAADKKTRYKQLEKEEFYVHTL